MACSHRGWRRQKVWRWGAGRERGKRPLQGLPLNGPLQGGSLAEQKTILTGDHHGLIWATGEKHGSGWSWRRGRESLCGCEGAPRSPQERTLSLSSQSRPACRRRGPRLFRSPGSAKAFPVKFRKQPAILSRLPRPTFSDMKLSEPQWSPDPCATLPVLLQPTPSPLPHLPSRTRAAAAPGSQGGRGCAGDLGV